MDLDSETTCSNSKIESFRLLDLPAEIYLAILELAVVQPGPICLHPHTPEEDSTLITKSDNPTLFPTSYPLSHPWQKLLQPPPITQANRLLRAEGLKLFYQRNVFHGLNWSDPRPDEWLSGIAADSRQSGKAFLVSSSWSAGEVKAYLAAKARFQTEAGEIGVEEVDEKEIERFCKQDLLCREARETRGGRLYFIRFS